MVLEDPLTAIGASAFVFFVLLGVLYLWDPQISAKGWWGILFVLVGITILLFLVGAAGIAGLLIGVIAAFVGKNALERMGIGE